MSNTFYRPIFGIKQLYTLPHWFPTTILGTTSAPQKKLKVKSFIILQSKGAWIQFNPETLKCWETLPVMMRSP